MRMIEQQKNGCVYASLAMVLNLDLSTVYHIFKCWEDDFPFSGEWDQVPRVPSMEEICDLSWRHYKTALVPFPLAPLATPHEDCNPISIWVKPWSKFTGQLSFGSGLIEGMLNGRGHMVAWDGKVVFDPRDYIYSINAASRFDFEPRRFWLAVKQ